MRRTLWRAVSMVFVVGLALIGCDGPNRSQNPSSGQGFNVNVAVSPNTLRGATPGTGEAQGGCANVIVKVFDVNGRLVDGALVTLTTTLGRFPATAGGQEFVAVSGTTLRGVFTFPICAKAERGTGTLTATTQDAVATALFTVF
jgi:hypothetical protein